MIVLSLFDGMSCGQLALQRAGIKVEKYYASEIDKNAIKITQKNFPNTIQLGDVTQWKEWNLSNIDLLIGGSPCQGFSKLGDGLNFEDPRSKLFFEFVDILNHYKPKYFLLENVKMKKEWKDIISKKLGVEPIEINSSLVSAQNRERLYWTNIPGVQQPDNKNIYLKDILEDNVDEQYYMNESWNKWWKENKEFQLKKKYSAINPDKAITMTSRQYASWNGNFISEPFVFTEKRTEEAKQIRKEYRKQYGKDWRPRRGKELVPREDNKCNCLTTSLTKEHMCFDGAVIRKLTPVECERLQTLPDNYTYGVTDTQRYKMLGNGWTVDVICHIFSYLKINKQAVNL